MLLDGTVPTVSSPSALVAVAFCGGYGALAGPHVRFAGSLAQTLERVAALEEREHPRWVWWSAARESAPLLERGIWLTRCWDVAEAHRLLAGGWAADPGLAWATAHGLDPAALPRAAGGDLFDFTGEEVENDPDAVIRSDGYLRPEAVTGDWRGTPERLAAWADAALATAERQTVLLGDVGPRAVGTAHSESAAALLCVELERDGLPVDRPTATALIAAAAGPRPESEAHARRIREDRDGTVLRHTPGRESTDLRNPVQVRDLLASVGVVVPDTRAWRLEPFRGTHPLVEALLTWRKAERIATTYGYAWLVANIGADDRLRGTWTACDGAGGRMTAQNGLHNLPTPLRPAIAAHAGHVFVRADLGQIEPRVLAAVSGDRAFAAATRADDLYSPVATALRIERPVAKVAVLAAMYGQRSGPAGEALKDLERTYPVAMDYLERAYERGREGLAVRTFGGRRVPVGAIPPGVEPTAERGMAAARGRFARNAVIQGAAAELFKAWAATVRLRTRDLGAQIVLCLHDELLLHVPEAHAEAVAALVDECLIDSSRRWSGTAAVRFVADTSIISRWSQAKD